MNKVYILTAYDSTKVFTSKTKGTQSFNNLIESIADEGVRVTFEEVELTKEVLEYI